MKKIKILIVDDSTLIRKIVKDLLETDLEIEVVGVVKNGKEALEFLKTNKVDVITLDVEMPVMDGITTLKEIMKLYQIPVVMLSSHTKEGAEMTFKALDNGAVDFIAKPSNVFNINGGTVQEEIIEKIKNASKVKIKKLSFKTRDTSGKTEKLKPVSTINKINSPLGNASEIKKIIAIGTSTGGPRALQELISNLSGKISAPILVVQHMPKGFTKSLAERLNTMSELQVKEAEDGEALINGTVYIAPGDRHIKIDSQGRNKYKIKLDDGENVSGHKPSVDAMFYSLEETNGADLIAVIMTGMGSDGAKGMSALKQKRNSYNIAEDESSCVVFGMPKAAIATQSVDKILPLNKIASEINRLMGV